MKPFDLEAAKRGEPVSMEARHTGWDYIGPVHFVGVSSNDLPVVEVNGKAQRVAPEYLRMAPKKRTVYVQIFNKPTDMSEETPSLKAIAFENKGDAEDNVKETSWPVLVAALPVEIEE
ncbi:hypothetical protein PQR39_35505 [Paraburkholderia sediminicola]|uniref:hypothetical protein n=1 Tax=Paraburkholderia sediminicola TaxID=458836 RepID=UPI0038B9A2CF